MEKEKLKQYKEITGIITAKDLPIKYLRKDLF